MSTIQNHNRVSIQYTVKDSEGNIVDDTKEPVQYTHGQKQIFPALEENLLGREAGDEFEVELSAEETYGEYDENSTQRVSITSLEHIEDIEVGMTLFTGSEKDQQALTVLDIDAGEVLLDANHPLAGKTLKFSVTVIAID
ncbi:MAG: peptidylprolyl isomerase [Sinobacterium sp.]|nr:peptidylprolyl isomerase [Sinobacterium sp.]